MYVYTQTHMIVYIHIYINTYIRGAFPLGAPPAARGARAHRQPRGALLCEVLVVLV